MLPCFYSLNRYENRSKGANKSLFIGLMRFSLSILDTKSTARSLPNSFSSAFYFVSFQVEVVYPVLNITDQRTVFSHPVFLILFRQFYNLRSDTVDYIGVFFFTQQPSGIPST